MKELKEKASCLCNWGLYLMYFASIICNLTLSGAKFREKRSYQIVYKVRRSCFFDVVCRSKSGLALVG